jgi:asparagine synthase (glutamine-hydrolysing)
MFAFVLFDRSNRQIHFVRDRLGKKPLYFGWVGEHLLFASELKAFHTHPAFQPVLDRGALALMLRHSCVPSPYTIFENIFKLSPGARLSLPVSSPNVPRGVELLEVIESYWSPFEVAEAGLRDPFRGSFEEALDELEQHLGRAVAERMIADVPLGAFLSGGVDSSAVVALMQKQASRPVKTFSIGFTPADFFDEAVAAKAVAQHLGTDHTELYVTPEETQAVIPKLPEMYDEPFSDQSQIPVALVAKLAREQVTVVLSGDGGDELFGGYQRHTQARTLSHLCCLPVRLRTTLSHGLRSVPPAAWNRLLGRPAADASDRLHKLADVIEGRDPDAIYHRMTSHWTTPAAVVAGAHEPRTLLTDPAHRPAIPDFALRMMVYDAATYLPDDVLTKVDRATMAVALEARAPILDHRVYAFAWRLPRAFKIHNGEGKWILKALLARYVPKRLTDRPKQGFGIPVGAWLAGPLREWAEDLLAEDRLRRDGIFRPKPIRRVWQEHLAGRRNWGYHLWDVLMFQAWRDRWLPG